MNLNTIIIVFTKCMMVIKNTYLVKSKNTKQQVEIITKTIKYLISDKFVLNI